MLANLVVTGKLPTNAFSPGVGAPIAGNVAVNSTGGSLAGGSTIRLTLCALDASGLPSVPMPIAIVPLPAGGATYSITLSNIVWPAVASLSAYVIFAAAQDDLICGQQLGTVGSLVASGALTPTGGGTTYTPGSITFTGPLQRSTFALPSPYVSKVRVKAKHLRHSGIIGDSVWSVAPGQLVVGSFQEAPPSTNPNWTPVGRFISVIGRPEGAAPLFSGKVTSWDPNTGTVGVTPDPNGIVEAGDCIALRFTADASNASNPTSITDSGWQSPVYPNGMTPGAELGALVRVTQGASRGTPPRKITANTATSITWDLPMVINPGDVWIIEEPTWPYSCDTTSFQNGNPLTVATLNMPTNCAETAAISSLVS